MDFPKLTVDFGCVVNAKVSWDKSDIVLISVGLLFFFLFLLAESLIVPNGIKYWTLGCLIS